MQTLGRTWYSLLLVAGAGALGACDDPLLVDPSEVHPGLDLATTATEYTVAFRTETGHYFQAWDGGGSTMSAAGPQIAGWETFFLKDLNGGTLESGDKVQIRTNHTSSTYYVRAEGGGGSGQLINATSTQAGTNETFTIIRASGTGTITPGTPIALGTPNGTHYVQAWDGGGGELRDNGPQIASWETFTLQILTSPATVHKVVFQTSNGKNAFQAWDAGGGTMSAAGPVDDGAWETFFLIDRNGGSLESGDQVNIQTHNELHYVVAEGGGGAGISATSTQAGTNETFTIIRASGTGTITPGTPIALGTPNGTHYVQAWDGGGGELNGRGPQIDAWETFTLLTPSPARIHRVAFRTETGHYFQAWDGGGSTMSAAGPQIAGWETFFLIDLNGGTLESEDEVQIRTNHSTPYYVVAEGGGGSGQLIKASSTRADVWETFRIVRASGTGSITLGTQVALRTPNGTHYVQAWDGGGGELRDNGPQIAGWETFTLEDAPSRFSAFTGFSTNLGNPHRIPIQYLGLDGRQARQYVGWERCTPATDTTQPPVIEWNEAQVVEFARNNAGKRFLYIFLDEPGHGTDWDPSGCEQVSPKHYAMAYRDFVTKIKNADASARFSPAGFEQFPANATTSYPKAFVEYAQEFVDEYVALYGTAPPVTEWRFHVYWEHGWTNRADINSSDGTTSWKIKADSATAFANRNNAPVVLAFGYPWLDYDSTMLTGMSNMITYIRSQPTIISGAWWSYDAYNAGKNRLTTFDPATTEEAKLTKRELTELGKRYRDEINTTQ